MVPNLCELTDTKDGFFFNNTIINMLKNVKFCKSQFILETVKTDFVILHFNSYFYKSGT